MNIRNNNDLRQSVENLLKELGITKVHIAKKLGVSRQQVDNIFSKKHFSLDDANKILNIVGYYIDDVSIKKI